MSNIKQNNCASNVLAIITYYSGKGQVTHPSLLVFDNSWNGHKYYLGYTPYPYANGTEENPCLAVSDDLVHWEKPEGLVNPIATCEESECDELKDAHLVYRVDLDRIEMWYLGRLNSTIKDGGPLYLFRKTSSDGRVWSHYKICYQLPETMVSPSIIWKDGIYQLWWIQNTSDSCKLLYMTSHDGCNWSNIENCHITGTQTGMIWHGSVALIDNKYIFVFVGNKKPYNQNIYLCSSDDGITFSSPISIIYNDVGWKMLYRPFPIKIDNTYYIFYGVVRLDNQWYISMSQGPSFEKLVGFSGDTNISPLKWLLRLKQLHKSIFVEIPAKLEVLVIFGITLSFFINNIILYTVILLFVSIILNRTIIHHSTSISLRNGLLHTIIIGGSVWFISSIIKYFVNG
jgi:hypothetical protein